MYVKIFVFLEEGCSVQVTPSFESKKNEKHFRETTYTTSRQP